MSRNGRGGRAAPNGYKVLSIILSFILLGAAITEAVLWKLDYIVFQNPKKEEQTQIVESGTPLDGEGNEMADGETYPMPKSMTFRSTETLDGTEAFDSVTLTATVKPESAFDKTVDWEISFVNPESEWATGKQVTDYVIVTPQSDGATTATVQCLQPFGEQMKIVVTSRDNENAKAECTVDFAKRVQKVNVTLKDTTGEENFVFGQDYSVASLGSYVQVYWEPVYTDYTVNDTFEYKLTGQINADLLSELQSDASILKYYTNLNELQSPTEFTGVQPWLIDDPNYFYNESLRSGTTSSGYSIFSGLYFGYDMYSMAAYSKTSQTGFQSILFDTSAYTAITGAVATALKENSFEYIQFWTLTATGTYSTYSVSSKMSYASENIKMAVSSVELDEEAVIL